MANNVVPIDALVGKLVLSKTTGNSLGKVDDLCIDAIKGQLAGLTIRESKNSVVGVDCEDVYSSGKDAIVVFNDEVVFDLGETLEPGHALAREDLVGIKVFTEKGLLLGEIANVFIQLTPPYLVFYEVRSSILDKLLGNNFFILASITNALSRDLERIIVPANTRKNGVARLKDLIDSGKEQEEIKKEFDSNESPPSPIEVNLNQEKSTMNDAVLEEDYH